MSAAQAGIGYIRVDMEAGVISSSSQWVSVRGASVPRIQTRPDAAASCSGTKGPGKRRTLTFGGTDSTLLDVRADSAPTGVTAAAAVRHRADATAATAATAKAGLIAPPTRDHRGEGQPEPAVGGGVDRALEGPVAD